VSDPRFAQLPPPPYHVVIFSSKRSTGDQGYGDMAARMEELVARQPGFLGLESARGADGFGITVGYFRTEADMLAWKADAEHRLAQELGHQRWYEHFEVRVGRVERAYGGPHGRGASRD
jgi:heme-degrading monooxygenase HmoA